jgi:peptidoglycan/LPS O-acetylase OafA/YrhL
MPLIQLWNNRLYESVGVSLFHLGVAFSLLHVMERRYSLLNSPLMVWVGAVSYSLYLWQQVFLNRWSTAPWTAFPLNLVLAFLLAAASYYMVEQPFLKLRGRFSPARVPFVVAPQPSSAVAITGD